MVCLRRLYCLRVLTRGVFEEDVLFKGTHTWRLYCLRVLTRGVFEEVVLFKGTHTWCV